MLQAGDQPRVGLPGLPQHQLGSLPQMRRQRRRRGLLLVEPGAVAGHERLESRPQLVGCRPSRERPSTATRPSPIEPASAASRRREARSSTPRSRAAPRLDRPVHRAGAADRELEPVAVLEVEARDLLVVLGPVLLEHVAHGQEHLGAAGVDPQLGLEHPHAHRDRHRRLAVVAQRDLDQHPPKLRVVVPVDAQARIDSRSGTVAVLPGTRSASWTDRDLLDRNPLVVTDRPTGLCHLVRLDRLVRAPRRRHDRTTPGQLAPGTAVPSRPGSSSPASAPGPRRRHRRHPPRSRQPRTPEPRAPRRFRRRRSRTSTRSRARVVVVRDADDFAARQLHRRDVADEVLRPRTERQHLLRPVDRAEQLTLRDVGEVLAHRERRTVRARRFNS